MSWRVSDGRWEEEGGALGGWRWGGYQGCGSPSGLDLAVSHLGPYTPADIILVLTHFKEILLCTCDYYFCVTCREFYTRA